MDANQVADAFKAAYDAGKGERISIYLLNHINHLVEVKVRVSIYLLKYINQPPRPASLEGLKRLVGWYLPLSCHDSFFTDQKIVVLLLCLSLNCYHTITDV